MSREAFGFKAVRFSCDERINRIGLSGLHPTIRGLARPEPEGPLRESSGTGPLLTLAEGQDHAFGPAPSSIQEETRLATSRPATAETETSKRIPLRASK